MDITKIKAIPEKHRMSVHLTIRVSPGIKNWLVENHYSPTAIFHEAIKEIGYKRDDGEDLILSEVEQVEEQPRDNPEESYYIKQRVETRNGWRTKLIPQFRPKKYGRRYAKRPGLAHRDMHRRKYGR